MLQELPVLYSFRRCPYAIRARLALCYCALQVEIREIKLGNKPVELIRSSSKATVPVLVLTDGSVIEESLDIIYWALNQNDPEFWLDQSYQHQTNELIKQNDGSFKMNLDFYKYSDRFPENSQQSYRLQAEVFLKKLETLLQQNTFLLTDRITLVDIAIMPFIRQFASVEPDWFVNSEYKRVSLWLNGLINSGIFSQVMTKYDFWKAGDEKVYFPRH